MRRSRWALIALAAAAAAAALVVLLGYGYVAEQRRLEPYPVVEPSTPVEDRSRPGIAVIGDSWVAYSKLDQPLETALEARGFSEARILSFGQGGAVSREILLNLLAPRGSPNSSRSVLEDGSIQYGVVVAGVNDTAMHIGSDFYAHHVVAIATALLGARIKPVIVEVPEYGIEYVDTLRSAQGKVREMIYRQLFDGGRVDVIDEYRQALREKLDAEDLTARVVLVDADRFVDDYDTNTRLYENASHLNGNGMRLLADVIADAIVADERASN